MQACTGARLQRLGGAEERAKGAAGGLRDAFPEGVGVRGRVQAGDLRRSSMRTPLPQYTIAGSTNLVLQDHAPCMHPEVRPRLTLQRATAWQHAAATQP